MDAIESESELVGRAVEGDNAALQRLLMIHYDDLLGAIDRRLPAEIRSVVSAEDILQDAFCEVYERIATFENKGDGSFAAWLRQIAKNRMLDRRRELTAQKRGGGRVQIAPARLDSETMTGMLEQLAMTPRTASRSAQERELASAFQDAYADLAPEYREALFLRYGRRLSCAAVAKHLGKTEGAVQMLCHRALREMREALGSLSRFLSKLE